SANAYQWADCQHHYILRAGVWTHACLHISHNVNRKWKQRCNPTDCNQTVLPIVAHSIRESAPGQEFLKYRAKTAKAAKVNIDSQFRGLLRNLLSLRCLL